MIFILSGPGGAGKGTVASRLVGHDPTLWLSRSWTTRPRRESEDPEAYVFVDRPTFEARARDGGFLETAEFLGELYGTPHPEAPPGRDVLLEIDVQGAEQVKKVDDTAVIILLLPPSVEVQAERLRQRGESEAEVQRRIAKGREEEATGRRLTSHVVINDDVDRAVAQIAGILHTHR